MLVVSGCAAPAKPPVVGAASAEERVPFGPDLRAAEVRALLATIRDGYSHLEEKKAAWGLDLAALEARYAPLARRAERWDQYELVMVSLVSEFHDAHMAWRRVRAAGERKRRIARLGLSTRFVGETLLVSEVWKGAGADRAGLAVGDRIVAIDGQDVEARFKDHAALRSWSRIEDARHDFADDWPASRYEVGEAAPVRQVGRAATGGAVETLAIPSETERPADHPRERLAITRRGAVTLVRIPSLGELGAPKKLDEIIAAVDADPRGLAIDLRDDAGGYEYLARALVSHLVAHPIVAGEVRVRLTPQSRAEHGEWHDLAPDTSRPGWSAPQPVRAEARAKRDYPARIAVLVDAGCRSSCETAALLLRAAGARLFGERTGGSSGAPVAYTLPWSHAKVTVPAWRMSDAKGAEIEGVGVAPDEEIAWTREDLVAARDPVLDAALRWLAPTP